MQSRIDPTEVVERRRRPKGLAANRNLRQGQTGATILLGLKPRDLAALTEVLDPDAPLESLDAPSDLTPQALAGAGVNRIVTPLTGHGFDAVDLAHHLAQIGFRGRLQVLIPPLPKPELVQREIMAAGKAIAVELILPRAGWRSLA